MFSANLSSSILRLCGIYKLSYEAASERCELSPRYFAQIARGKTSPSILTLEKLCIGFDPDAERPADPFLLPPAGALVSHPDARHRGSSLPGPKRLHCVSRLPALRTNHGAGVPVVLRPLWPVPGLGALSLSAGSLVRFAACRKAPPAACNPLFVLRHSFKRDLQLGNICAIL